MLEVIIETTEIMIQQSFLQELEKQKAKIIDWLEETHNQFRQSNISSEEKVKVYFKNKWNSLHTSLNSHYKAWSYKKKKYKKIKAYWKSLQEEPTVNRFLLILELKPFRS